MNGKKLAPLDLQCCWGKLSWRILHSEPQWPNCARTSTVNCSFSSLQIRFTSAHLIVSEETQTTWQCLLTKPATEYFELGYGFLGLQWSKGSFVFTLAKGQPNLVNPTWCRKSSAFEKKCLPNEISHFPFLAQNRVLRNEKLISCL